MCEPPAKGIVDYPVIGKYTDATSMSVFCRSHPLEDLRGKLAVHGIVTARDLRGLPSGRCGGYSCHRSYSSHEIREKGYVYHHGGRNGSHRCGCFPKNPGGFCRINPYQRNPHRGGETSTTREQRTFHINCHGQGLAVTEWATIEIFQKVTG